jgi:hypothetical protein
MGMQQKLNKAYQEGFEAGKKAEQLPIEIKGYVKGCHDTWDIVENIIKNAKGIGPKTQDKIIGAIREHAEKEAKRGDYGPKL